MTRKEDIKFDFALKNGSILGALIRFLIVLTMFVIIPYAVYYFISDGLSGAGGGLLGSADIDEIAWAWVSNMIKYSIPLVILAIPIGFYRKGSYARIPFKVVFALYLSVWFWISSHGGIFDATLHDVEIVAGTLSTITLNLNVRYIVYVMMILSIAMVFLVFTEFAGNRKKYLEWLEKKKDTMSERKARRLSG